MVTGVLVCGGIVISAGYSIHAYNRVCLGGFSKYLFFSRDLNRREFHSLLPLVFSIVVWGLFPCVIVDRIGVLH